MPDFQALQFIWNIYQHTTSMDQATLLETVEEIKAYDLLEPWDVVDVPSTDYRALHPNLLHIVVTAIDSFQRLLHAASLHTHSKEFAIDPYHVRCNSLRRRNCANDIRRVWNSLAESIAIAQNQFRLLCFPELKSKSSSPQPSSYSCPRETPAPLQTSSSTCHVTASHSPPLPPSSTIHQAPPAAPASPLLKAVEGDEKIQRKEKVKEEKRDGEGRRARERLVEDVVRISSSRSGTFAGGPATYQVPQAAPPPLPRPPDPLPRHVITHSIVLVPSSLPTVSAPTAETILDWQSGSRTTPETPPAHQAPSAMPPPLPILPAPPEHPETLHATVLSSPHSTTPPGADPPPISRSYTVSDSKTSLLALSTRPPPIVESIVDDGPAIPASALSKSPLISTTMPPPPDSRTLSSSSYTLQAPPMTSPPPPRPSDPPGYLPKLPHVTLFSPPPTVPSGNWETSFSPALLSPPCISPGIDQQQIMNSPAFLSDEMLSSSSSSTKPAPPGMPPPLLRLPNSSSFLTSTRRATVLIPPLSTTPPGVEPPPISRSSVVSDSPPSFWPLPTRSKLLAKTIVPDGLEKMNSGSAAALVKPQAELSPALAAPRTSRLVDLLPLWNISHSTVLVPTSLPIPHAVDLPPIVRSSVVSGSLSRSSLCPTVSASIAETILDSPKTRTAGLLAALSSSTSVSRTTLLRPAASSMPGGDSSTPPAPPATPPSPRPPDSSSFPKETSHSTVLAPLPPHIHPLVELHPIARTILSPPPIRSVPPEGTVVCDQTKMGIVALSRPMPLPAAMLSTSPPLFPATSRLPAHAKQPAPPSPALDMPHIATDADSPPSVVTNVKIFSPSSSTDSALLARTIVDDGLKMRTPEVALSRSTATAPATQSPAATSRAVLGGSSMHDAPQTSPPPALAPQDPSSFITETLHSIVLSPPSPCILPGVNSPPIARSLVPTSSSPSPESSASIAVTIVLDGSVTDFEGSSTLSPCQKAVSSTMESQPVASRALLGDASALQTPPTTSPPPSDPPAHADTSHSLVLMPPTIPPDVDYQPIARSLLVSSSPASSVLKPVEGDGRNAVKEKEDKEKRDDERWGSKDSLVRKGLHIPSPCRRRFVGASTTCQAPPATPPLPSRPRGSLEHALDTSHSPVLSPPLPIHRGADSPPSPSPFRSPAIAEANAHVTPTTWMGEMTISSPGLAPQSLTATHQAPPLTPLPLSSPLDSPGYMETSHSPPLPSCIPLSIDQQPIGRSPVVCSSSTFSSSYSARSALIAETIVHDRSGVRIVGSVTALSRPILISPTTLSPPSASRMVVSGCIVSLTPPVMSPPPQRPPNTPGYPGNSHLLVLSPPPPTVPPGTNPPPIIRSSAVSNSAICSSLSPTRAAPVAETIVDDGPAMRTTIHVSALSKPVHILSTVPSPHASRTLQVVYNSYIFQAPLMTQEVQHSTAPTSPIPLGIDYPPISRSSVVLAHPAFSPSSPTCSAPSDAPIILDWMKMGMAGPVSTPLRPTLVPPIGQSPAPFAMPPPLLRPPDPPRPPISLLHSDILNLSSNISVRVLNDLLLALGTGIAWIWFGGSALPFTQNEECNMKARAWGAIGDTSYVIAWLLSGRMAIIGLPWKPGEDSQGYMDT